MVEVINQSNFDQKAKGKVIIDFFADWCGPCRMLTPLFQELSEEFKGKLGFFKINVDESPDLANRFGVSGIPCLVVIENGKEIDRIVGFHPKASLKQKIEDIIK
ncbi:MAG: thioredoxin [Nanoarchaeota archaeon]|nr:thioredoxin [Nanoarchaeota archaeon]